MVNQLGKFLYNLATETEPLRGLLSTGSSWYWDQPQRDAFNEIKRMLSSSPVLSLYDPNLPTVTPRSFLTFFACSVRVMCVYYTEKLHAL